MVNLASKKKDPPKKDPPNDPPKKDPPNDPKKKDPKKRRSQI